MRIAPEMKVALEDLDDIDLNDDGPRGTPDFKDLPF
jgi:hypothetical protein